MTLQPETHGREESILRKQWWNGAARAHQGGRCGRCDAFGAVARQDRCRLFECFDCWRDRAYPPTRRRGRVAGALEAAAAAAAVLAILWLSPAGAHAQPAGAVTVAEINQAIEQRFGPRLAPTMRCIGHYESRYDENPSAALAAVGPTADHGVMQIHVYGSDGGRWIYGRFFSIAELHTLRGNLDAAYRLLTRAGRGAVDLYHWRAQEGRCF